MQIRFAGFLAFTLLIAAAHEVSADDLKPGDPAPRFQAATSAGTSFDLDARSGQWTVLYFYPKAGTPGCTDQARGYRDHLDAVRAQGAEVFGISTDSVAQQAQFDADEHLGFTLLADPDGAVTRAYGAKMPVVTYARRWTFVIDPELKIRHVDRDVDPAADAERVAATIARLKSEAPPAPRP